jgi:hypothetical protein
MQPVMENSARLRAMKSPDHWRPGPKLGLWRKTWVTPTPRHSGTQSWRQCGNRSRNAAAPSTITPITTPSISPGDVMPSRTAPMSKAGHANLNNKTTANADCTKHVSGNRKPRPEGTGAKLSHFR